MNKYALVNISDEVEDCYVKLYETEKLAIKALKKELVEEIWPEDEEMKEKIMAAETYEQLENINDCFHWGENDVRMYWIVEIRNIGI